MQNEIRSKKLRVRRGKCEENVADLGTKPLSKAVISKHCLALGYVNMAEENVQCERQVVAMSRRQPAAIKATSSNRSSGSKRAKRPTKCLQAISRSSQEIVRDVNEKLPTLLRITTRSSNRLQKVRTGRIPTSSQTEASLRAPNVSVARTCCSSEVSLTKKLAESTTLLPRAL